MASCGRRFDLVDGVPDFVGPSDIQATEEPHLANYDRAAHVFDRVVAERFQELGTPEPEVRRQAVARLRATKGATVLELGCGTGANFVPIADALGGTGRIVGTDASKRMLERARARNVASGVSITLARSTATGLPLDDASVDRVLNFGCVNTVADQPRLFAEMWRVVRPGGRVVVMDEGAAPWRLEKNDIPEVALESPFVRSPPPRDLVPKEVRDLEVGWTIHDCFYVLEFDKP